MKLFGSKKSGTQLQEVLRGQEAPAFPSGTMKLLRLMRDPDADIENIAEALSWNAGLVVRVLGTVNSAAFGMNRKIDSVRHAVTILGRSKLEQLVLGIATKNILPSAPAPGFDPNRFWLAAGFRASLARSIASELHPADEERCFIGGLLQDLAVPVLAHARPDEYGRVLQSWHDEKESHLHVLEQEALGWSHDEMGEQLARSWELPEPLTRIVRAHHSDDADEDDLPPAMRLVAMHRETEREHGIEVLIEEGRSRYGLDPDRLQEAVRASEEQARELATVL